MLLIDKQKHSLKTRHTHSCVLVINASCISDNSSLLCLPEAAASFAAVKQQFGVPAGGSSIFCNSGARGSYGCYVHSPEAGHFRAQPCHSAACQQAPGPGGTFWRSLPQGRAAPVALSGVWEQHCPPGNGHHQAQRRWCCGQFCLQGMVWNLAEKGFRVPCSRLHVASKGARADRCDVGPYVYMCSKVR